MAMMRKVNMILFRRSGTLNMFFKLASMVDPWLQRPRGGVVRLAVREGVALRGRATMTERRRKHAHRSAGRFDGLAGGRGEGVGGDGERPRQLSTAQHLHQPVLVHESLGPQRVRAHLVALE